MVNINLPKAFEHFYKTGFNNCFRQVRNPDARASFSLATWFLGPFNRKNLYGAQSSSMLFNSQQPAGSKLPNMNETPTKAPGRKW